MDIPRPIYLQKLAQRRDNGMAKVITGIRRCGKSFLLFNIFRRHLLESGVPEERIVGVDLDGIEEAGNMPLGDDRLLYQADFRKKVSHFGLIDVGGVDVGEGDICEICPNIIKVGFTSDQFLY